MNTDNKQTRESEFYFTGNALFQKGDSIPVMLYESFGRTLAAKEENAELVLEAFNTKALTGKGPKEMWEENKQLRDNGNEYLLSENKQLSEKVKKLKAGLQKIADFTESWKYQDAWREVYNTATESLNK